MNDYPFVVIETYPEPVGGTWKHFYNSVGEGLLAAHEMQKAHPHRTYELIDNKED